MAFNELLEEFTAAVAAGDGPRFAAVFCEDGEYHDVFYGLFKGRERIAEMLEGYFHRDGEDFQWVMSDVVDDGAIGYARWFFSYTGKVEQIRGKRIFMEGIGRFHLKDGLIERYEDFVKSAELMQQMNLAPEKRDHIIARMSETMLAQPEFEPHKRN